MRTSSFDAQVAALRIRLKQELPGVRAHLLMAPGYRSTPDQLDITDKPCRNASVLALLFPLHPTSPGVLLIKRRDDLPEHAGQIAFPGGRQEAEETLEQTALRETEEEIGISTSQIDIIGSLSPLYISVSNYCVHPFVGVLHAVPDEFQVQRDEVQRVLKISLAQLALPSTIRTEDRLLRNQNVRIPAFYIDNERIWGATAMMLSELLATMGLLEPEQ